jgi:hypothetical protein
MKGRNYLEDIGVDGRVILKNSVIDILNLHTYLNVTDQLLQPYKTMCKITVLYTITFTFSRYHFADVESD